MQPVRSARVRQCGTCLKVESSVAVAMSGIACCPRERALRSTARESVCLCLVSVPAGEVNGKWVNGKSGEYCTRVQCWFCTVVFETFFAVLCHSGRGRAMTGVSAAADDEFDDEFDDVLSAAQVHTLQQSSAGCGTDVILTCAHVRRPRAGSMEGRRLRAGRWPADGSNTGR